MDDIASMTRHAAGKGTLLTTYFRSSRHLLVHSRRAGKGILLTTILRSGHRPLLANDTLKPRANNNNGVAVIHLLLPLGPMQPKRQIGGHATPQTSIRVKSPKNQLVLVHPKSQAILMHHPNNNGGATNGQLPPGAQQRQR